MPCTGARGQQLSCCGAAGELDRTLIIATSDNGMPFPRAKANLYEFGLHMPLAIRWGDRAPGGRTVDDLVGFVDLPATILQAAGVKPPVGDLAPVGRSLVALLASAKQGVVEPFRTAVFAARERHSSSRYDNWTYPQRALRTPDFLYIRNFRPDRWPAGDPVVPGSNGQPQGPHSGYKDIDGSPTLSFLIERAEDPALGRFLELAVGKRPAEELFDIRRDPGCLTNLAGRAAFADVQARLGRQLEETLRATGDARILDGGDIWEAYPRYSPIRRFPPPEPEEPV